MNDQHIERLLGLLGSIAGSLSAMAGAQDGDAAPDLTFPIDTYQSFDWAGIGAQVIAKDSDGPSVVMWNGKNFKRRAPDNAFDPAIWFSHCIGKTEDGRNEYIRLVTFKQFKDDDIQPLGRRAERALQSPPRAATVTSVTTAQPPAETPALASQPATRHAEDVEDAGWNAMPSAGAALPPAPPKTTRPIGPQVSAGAAPHTNPDICPTCDKPWRYENPACPAHRAPAITPAPPERATAVRPAARQATIGGTVNADFRNWAKDFAYRHPQYQIRATGDVDMYHILMTIGAFGIALIDDANLAAVKTKLEEHASHETH